MRLLLILILGTLIGKLYGCEDTTDVFNSSSFGSFKPGFRSPEFDEDPDDDDDVRPQVIHLDIPAICKWCGIEVIKDPFSDFRITEEEIITEDD